MNGILGDEADAQRLLRVLGASEGIGRVPGAPPGAAGGGARPARGTAHRGEVRRAAEEVGARRLAGEKGWNALRIAYRRELLRLAAWDLEQPSALAVVDRVGVGAGRPGGGSARRVAAARTIREQGDVRGCRGHEARDHRHGQGGRARAELPQRRRRDLRHRERGDRRDRHPPRDGHHEGHRRARPRAAALGGRREPAPRGQGRRPGAQPRLAHRVLRAVGEELGVPGAAEGASARRRPRARRAVRGTGGAVRLVERLARGFRRLGAADAGARHREHPGGRGRHPAQARAGRAARRRVHDPAAAARARACRPAGAGAFDAGSSERPRGAWLHRARRGGGLRPRLPVPAAARASPAAVAHAAHPPHAPRRRRVAGPGASLRHRHHRGGSGRGLAADEARRAHPARAAVLPPAALGRRRAARRRLRAHQRAGRGAAGGDRVRRPAGRPAPHRRAHGRRLAALADPAHPAARHAPVVRRGRRPRLRAPDVPAAERRSGGGVLVPADAAGLVGRGPPPHARAVQLAVRRHPVRAHPRGRSLAGERRRTAPALARRAARGDGGDRRTARRRSGCRGEGPAHRPPPRGAAPRTRRHPGPDHASRNSAWRSARSPRPR